MFKVTRDWLQSNKTANGGWTRVQLEALGLSWPPPKGWVQQVIGMSLVDEQVEQFERSNKRLRV